MQKNVEIRKVTASYLESLKTDTWDYITLPAHLQPVDVYKLIVAGKTIREVAYASIAQFGSVAGGLLSVVGHISKSTEKAIRKGVTYAFERAN
jgi:hypothetical protein